MENISILERTEIATKFVMSGLKDNHVKDENPNTNPALENLVTEGGEDFYQYLNWMGLAKEPNLMVLSSMHHYYYDFDDLKGIKTLINLKKLNQIKHLDSFLHTVFRILPSNACFIGCFKESTNKTGISFYNSTRIFNGIRNIIDSRADRIMSKKEAKKLLEEHGFKIIDTTVINGLTYFCSKNKRRSAE